MKKGFWTADWFAGLVITFAVLVSATMTGWVDTWFERPAYDLGVRLSSSTPSDKVAVIAIDDESIANIGRWPWPRSVMAKMITNLSAGGAKVIGSSVLFLEPQRDPGLATIQSLSDYYQESEVYQNAAPEAEILTLLVERLAALAGEGTPAELADSISLLQEFVGQSSLLHTVPAEAEALGELFLDASDSLDTDLALADAIEAAGSVVLGMEMYAGEVLGNPDEALSEYVTDNAISNVADPSGAQEQGLLPISTYFVVPPIPTVGFVTAGIGHMTTLLDVDGAVRFEPLVLRYYDEYYPSMALQLAAKSLNLGVDDIKINLGEGVQLGGLTIRTDASLLMNTFYYADVQGKPAFSVDSFFDVIEGKIPANKYKDKIVLIGPTALGVGDSQKTPVSRDTAVVLLLAHTLSSILEEDFFVSPPWSHWAQMGVTLLVILYLMLLLPRIRAGVAFVVSVVLLAILIGAHLGLMTTQRLWLQFMHPRRCYPWVTYC